MSSSSAPADTLPSKPGTRAERDDAAIIGFSGSGDTGEPVFDLPPLVEPMDFVEPIVVETPEAIAAPTPVQSSPPQPVPPPSPPGHFLFARADAPTPEPETTLAPTETHLPVELIPTARPVDEKAPPGDATVVPFENPPLTVPPELPLARSRQVQWAPPIVTRARLVGAGAIVLVLVLFIVLVDVLGIGPFSRMRHYPVSAAPTDPVARFGYFRSGAEAGEAEDQLQLAILYAKGDGVTQDYASAVTWFRAAANQGVPRAQYDLGVLYERGRGVPIDLTEAANWYMKAAQGGHPLAEYNLAVCYTKGQGIRKDLAEAALWYRRAAAQGVVQAMINLAMVYEKGEGVASSSVDAYAWYLAAGRRGNDPSAQRAGEVFASLPRLDQIHAEALASDVAASIHDPAPERGETAASTAEAGAAGH
jgi:hypothetical protein